MQAVVRNDQSLMDVSLLYGRTTPYVIQHLAHGMDQRPIDRATTGALMTTAAKVLGHAGHVEFALAAQAHSKAFVGKLAKECSYLDLADREDVIYQAFAVFFLRIATFHLLLRHPSPGNIALSIQIAQSLPQ